MIRIRPAAHDDAAAWADTVLQASSHLVVDAASVLHELRHDPDGTERRVALVDGAVVGVAHARVRPEEESASLLVMVAPARRRRGVGTALVEASWPCLRAVLVAGTLEAYALVGAAGAWAWSDMTGTLSEHRGRGYALLAKQHALRAAAAAGVTVAFTGNDAANAPMLAVNERLGYVPVASPALAERRL